MWGRDLYIGSVPTCFINVFERGCKFVYNDKMQQHNYAKNDMFIKVFITM